MNERGTRGKGQGSGKATAYPALRNPRSNGFTLLEVLLALTILAVITAAIYGSFSTAGRNVESAETLRSGTDLARTLIARLTSDIANARIVPGMTETFFFSKKNEVGEDKKRFDSLSFTTLTNSRRPDTKEMDLWEVGYFFQERPEDNVQVLYRKEKRELSKDVPHREGGVDQEISDAVAGLRFRYSSNGKTWQDEWTSGLPNAVEIVLTLADGRVYATEVDIRQQ